MIYNDYTFVQTQTEVTYSPEVPGYFNWRSRGVCVGDVERYRLTEVDRTTEVACVFALCALLCICVKSRVRREVRQRLLTLRQREPRTTLSHRPLDNGTSDSCSRCSQLRNGV